MMEKACHSLHALNSPLWSVIFTCVHEFRVGRINSRRATAELQTVTFQCSYTEKAKKNNSEIYAQRISFQPGIEGEQKEHDCAFNFLFMLLISLKPVFPHRLYTERT